MKKVYKVISVVFLLFMFTACSKTYELSDLQNIQIGNSVGSLLNDVGEPNKKLTGNDAYKAIDDDIKSYQKLNSLVQDDKLEQDIINASIASKLDNVEVWQYKFKTDGSDGTYSFYISNNDVVFAQTIK